MCLLEDLVEDILLRLDVKDLLQFKIVCKSWFSLISSHRFAISHLKQHNNNDSNLGHVRIALPTYWKVPNENLFRVNSWRVVGSSNGLVCFSPIPIYSLIFVNNPLTREIRKLPMPPPSQNNMPFGKMFLSFSYDSSTDDYKVVLATSMIRTKETLFQVLSLKSNTWKVIGLFKYQFFYTGPGVLFNGALHWRAFDYTSGETKKVILSFDLSREEFTVFPEPDNSKFKRCLMESSCYVGTVEDKLCLFFSTRDNYLPCNNIWVMRSSKGERFWELLPDNYQMKYEVVHIMKIFECTSSKKNRMTFFCDNNPCLSRASNHIDAPLFVPSLVSPYAGGPSRAKNNKTSVKSWSVKGIGKEDQQEDQQPQASVRNCIIKASGKTLRRIEAVYRREVGETENFYFNEEGHKRD